MTRRVLGAVADSGPVVVLAAIAAAGSFTHIRDTATDHGQRGWMAWAIAVCIDLTCVMAAGERRRDQRTGRDAARLSWPTLVLVGGILLSLAANLAQADASAWGWITAGTPAGAFLVAVSMLERRKTVPASVDERSSSVPAPDTVPPSASSPSSPWVVWEDDQPEPAPSVPAQPVRDDQARRDDAQPEPVPAVYTIQDDQISGDEQDGQTAIPASVADDESAAPPSGPPPAAPLVAFARHVATEHHNRHGKPITCDALRARLGVSNQLASDLLRQIRTEPASEPAPVA